MARYIEVLISPQAVDSGILPAGTVINTIEAADDYKPGKSARVVVRSDAFGSGDYIVSSKGVWAAGDQKIATDVRAVWDSMTDWSWL